MLKFQNRLITINWIVQKKKKNSVCVSATLIPHVDGVFVHLYFCVFLASGASGRCRGWKIEFSSSFRERAIRRVSGRHTMMLCSLLCTLSQNFFLS